TMFFERFFTLQPFIWGEHTYKIYPLDFLIIISCALAALHIVFQKIKLPSWSRVDALVLLFIAIVTGFFLVQYLSEWGEAALVVSAVKNYAFYVLLYFLVIIFADSRDAWKNVVTAFCVGGVLLLFFIVAGLIRGEGYWTAYTPLSTSGRRFLASTHAYYLTIPLILLFTRLVVEKVNHQFETGLLLLVQLFGIFGSLMRHIWIALVLGLGFIFLTIPHHAKHLFRRYVQTGVIIGALVLILFLLVMVALPFSKIATVLPDVTKPFTERITSIFSGSNDVSAGWRLDVWRATWDSFIRHPLVGIGFGQNMTFGRENYLLTVDIREIHNSPFAILVQMGLLGFIPFVLLIFFIFRSWWSAYRTMKDDDRFWVLGIGVSALVFLVASLFQPYLETNTTAIFFWILLGLMRTSTYKSSNDKIQSPNQAQNPNV
ncbi:O-antigen ligase family protein, partial [Candidatus Falkowbacteria bacterium]|nr:O-antigen ligase family protein [Candidatus Falkowbacteria bacterium]